MSVDSAEQPRSILKGQRFTARLAEICTNLPAAVPLEGMKYRRILIPGIVGGEDQFALLGFVGQALRLRGAEVTALCCDRFLPACVCRKADHVESACTRWCHTNVVPFLETLQLPHRWYSEFIEPHEVERCAAEVCALEPGAFETFEYNGIFLGEHIERSIENYFKVGIFDQDNPAMVEAGRQFVVSAMCLTLIGRRALETLEIEKVFVNDGRKNDWGVIRSVAADMGIPVDVSLYTPRGESVTFECDRPGQPADAVPRWAHWRDVPLDDAQNRALDAYIERRATRPFAGRSAFEHTRRMSRDEVRQHIGLPAECHGLRCGLFPNLSYDGKETSHKPAFFNAAEWILETIAYFGDQPDHQLVVKVHPAERVRSPGDPTLDLIERRFPQLPSNVFVVPPDTPLAAQDVLRELDMVMVFTSTIAIESAVFGKRVMMVGGGRHGGHGITVGINTPDEYFATLERACHGQPPPETPRELGRRYAYAAFFRMILPLTHVSSYDLQVTSLNFDKLEDLAPGCDQTMDIICRGILCDEPFEIDHWPKALRDH